MLSRHSARRWFHLTKRDTYTESMELQLKPETESRLHELVTKTGSPADDLLEDAMAGNGRVILTCVSRFWTGFQTLRSSRPAHSIAHDDRLA